MMSLPVASPSETIGQKLRRLARRAAVSNPLSNPPADDVTITVTANIDTSLTNNYTPAFNSEVFAIHGGTPMLFAGKYWFFPVSNVSPDTFGNCAAYTENRDNLGLDAWGWEVDFVTDAPLLHILIGGSPHPSSNFRIIVDDRYASFSPTAYVEKSGPSFVQLDFDYARKARRIRFRGMLNTLFGGVNVAPADAVWAPSQEDTIKAVFTGDSYVNFMPYPAGSISPDGWWPHIIGNELGWDDIKQAAVGATGYINPGSYEVFGTNRSRVPIIHQIPRWLDVGSDVIVFAAGFNDPVAGLTTAALKTFQAARAVNPTAIFFILGPWPGSGGQVGSAGAMTLRKEAAIRAAVSSFGDDNSHFIPQNDVNDPWISGTGYQGNVKGIGNSDYCIWVDGVHPTDTGHMQIGHCAARAIREIINKMNNK